jgi:hypothetical protein
MSDLLTLLNKFQGIYYQVLTGLLRVDGNLENFLNKELLELI